MSVPQLIAIGASAGGLAAIIQLFEGLPQTLNTPIVVVQHLMPDKESEVAEILARKFSKVVVDADDKMPIMPDHTYMAPPGYHLQIEHNRSFSLSLDEPVHFARPSIDVLFESAAAAYGASLIGILLTGANEDGAKGLESIQKAGGYVCVQDPSEASLPEMPLAGINSTQTKNVYKINEIAQQLIKRIEGID